MTDIFDYLRARPYPGRGILLGAAPDGAAGLRLFHHGPQREQPQPRL